jgi:hypothetical protein
MDQDSLKAESDGVTMDDRVGTSGEGSAWGVRPLPFCPAALQLCSQMGPQAGEALELWFEDEPLVEARSMEAIRAEVAEDLAHAPF